MRAWANAMETMDKLIDGIGCAVQPGALLLAITSWHLYPDLTVLGRVTKQILFNPPDTVRELHLAHDSDAPPVSVHLHEDGDQIPDDPKRSAYTFIFEDDEIALYSRQPWRIRTSQKLFDLHEVQQGLTRRFLDPLKILTRAKIQARSLIAIATAAKLFETMPGATVSVQILSQYLHSGKCQIRPLTRSEVFACICMFVSGSVDLDPAKLTPVMAISIGDSLYVAKSLLYDPSISFTSGVKHIPGNIGRPGIVLMFPPPNIIVQSQDPSSWRVVSHNQFDGRKEDNFLSTSLLISFTGYDAPLDTGLHGDKFVQVHFLETVISAFDGGSWVADLDVLKSIEATNLFKAQASVHCQNLTERDLGIELTTMDNWKELLNRSDGCAVVRANGNWLARLALSTVSTRQGYNTVILPGGDYCWHAVIKQVLEWLRERNPGYLGSDPPSVLADAQVISIQ
ncbi:MAG: hypothetical protein M1813_005509 [Trichoglossum hirsutum]|nr:MAG: hypothetical protein M1813_005509 [Trichoglossum hirsutum]